MNKYRYIVVSGLILVGIILISTIKNNDGKLLYKSNPRHVAYASSFSLETELDSGIIIPNNLGKSIIMLDEELPNSSQVTEQIPEVYISANEETEMLMELELRKELEAKEKLRIAEEIENSKIKEAVLSYNPFEKSNLTVEQYNNILKGSSLAGAGESYYKMEDTHGVNGLYAIAVAAKESSLGKHQANKNNSYGMRGKNGWMAFDSADSNIQYFGELMNKGMYKDKDILSIGKVYCPGTYKDWAASVKSIMKSYYAKR